MDMKPGGSRPGVNISDERLREELDKLMGKGRKGKPGAEDGESGFALDPFDRAVFRAILDVEEQFGLVPPPVSEVRRKVTKKP